MNGTITTRTFYLETEKTHDRDCPQFIIKASENGKRLNEYRNGQITQYYQADIFGVLAVVNDLIREK
jgi:hypothetical protein